MPDATPPGAVPSPAPGPQRRPLARGSSDTVVRLRDGSRVRIRPVRADDRERLGAFVHALSRDALELRFFAPVRADEVVDRILGTRPVAGRVSLLMETMDAAPRIVIAQGESVRDPPDPSRAEVAFLVADDRQGQGAATLLLWDLARRARALGVRRFYAWVLRENEAMLDVFRGAGFPSDFVWNGTEGRVTLDVSRPPATDTAHRGPPPAWTRSLP
ncbi:MAG TPA: GNAT family N-acetyltransferase [Thermoplasmata archaeon]|nr:GNAT family N-acetyltransferase [Thermoplasmata archaeon]